MNYKIIQNEQSLQEFITWLPDLKRNETLYLSLLARKKYNTLDSNLTADKCQLKRITSNKERLIEKIRQMECAVGSYTYKGETINQNNLALYITPNPRDLYKASLVQMGELCKELTKAEPIYSPHSSALNAIQISCGSKVFFDVDIDFNKNVDISNASEYFRDEIFKHINPECLTLIRTNGGLHCLIKLDVIHKQFIKTWYQSISNMACNSYSITMNGDNQIPLIGCSQGNNGFYPYFIGL